jgi:hypothetical protein
VVVNSPSRIFFGGPTSAPDTATMIAAELEANAQ